MRATGRQITSTVGIASHLCVHRPLFHKNVNHYPKSMNPIYDFCPISVRLTSAQPPYFYCSSHVTEIEARQPATGFF
jgi:hypothetical protein